VSDTLRAAVVADTEVLTPPCGIAPIIWEFARGAKIVFANLNGQSEGVSDCRPVARAFDARFLKVLSKIEVMSDKLSEPGTNAAGS